METIETKIQMRDGVNLQSFITFPKANLPLPTILIRCTYGHDKLEKSTNLLASAGYAVVCQNIRGRYDSEGELPGLGDTREDGYDTIDWLTKQSWCNGRIGTFGGSNLAKLQLATGFLGHPAHMAMCPQTLPYGMNSRFGGAYLYSQIPQWFYRTQSGPQLKSTGLVDWMPKLYHLPVIDCLNDLPDSIKLNKKIFENIFNSIWELPFSKELHKFNIPTRLVTGWYDHCGSGPIDFFMNIKKFGSEFQKKNIHLIIGPWDHSCNATQWDEYNYGESSVLNHLQEDIQFFDYHLKGERECELPAPVKIFVMGKNEWRDEQDWPLQRAIDTKFYLHSDGNVRGAWKKGSLSEKLPGQEKSDTFQYDPNDPVLTFGGANSAPASTLPMLRGSRDQRITLYRNDVLTYYTEPLLENLEVTGMLKMILYASSSAIDTDFTVKLMDISTDGNARLLSDGIVRARFRNGPKPTFLKPNEVQKYEIDLWFTSNVFFINHRIGIAISSSNFPRFNRNLNTGEDNETSSNMVKANQMVFHNASYPSHLILPVVKS